MICLDTNFLIRGLIANTEESKRLIDWHGSGEPMFASSVVWYEFLSGPIDLRQAAIIRSFLTDGIAPFTEKESAEAARLFNEVGRHRRLRVDAMIAATAILCDAKLATANRADFEPFVQFGLQLFN